MSALPGALTAALATSLAAAPQGPPRPGLSGQVRAGVQVLAGESRSPFLVGPDSAPLLNTGVLGQVQSSYNLVVTPNGEIRWHGRAQEYQLSYGPRLFIDLRRPGNTPTSFHIASARAAVGRANHLQAALTPSLTVGGLDLGAGGAAPGTLYAGAVRPGTVGGIPSRYVSFNLQGRLEGPVGRGHLSTTNLYALARSPPQPEVPATYDGLPVAGNLLYNLTRFESLNELALPARSATWRLQLAPGWTNFPATQTYLTLLPAVAWSRPLGRGGQLTARGGALVMQTGYLPGTYDQTQAIAVAEAGVSHGFQALGLTHLRGALGAILGPYYDPLFGAIQPRTTLTGNLAYDFSRRLSASLQVRYYTGRYVAYTVLPGRDLDVVISTLTLRGQVTREISAQLGGYTVNRHRVPSRTSSVSATNDYFVFVGLDGTLPL